MLDNYTWKLGFETAEVEGARSGIERRTLENRRMDITRGIFSNRMVEQRKLETRRMQSERRDLVHLNAIEAAIEKAGPCLIGFNLLFLSMGALILAIKLIPVSGILLMCFFLPCSIFCFYSFFEPVSDR